MRRRPNGADMLVPRALWVDMLGVEAPRTKLSPRPHFPRRFQPRAVRVWMLGGRASTHRHTHVHITRACEGGVCEKMRHMVRGGAPRKLLVEQMACDRLQQYCQMDFPVIREAVKSTGTQLSEMHTRLYYCAMRTSANDYNITGRSGRV